MDRITELTNSAFVHKALFAAYPHWPGFVLLAIVLSLLVGLPGAKPADEGQSWEVTAWRLQMAALGLAVGGAASLVIYWQLAGHALGSQGALLVGYMVSLYWPLYLMGLVGAIILRIWIVRHGKPWLSAKLRDLRVTQHTDKLSDVRAELERQASSNGSREFTPADHYQSGEVFTGFSPTGRKIMIPEDVFLGTHHVVIGATRYGKGITFQTWAEQAVLRGDTVVVVDPKGDEYLPAVLERVAGQVGRPFVFVNLNDDGVGRWGPVLAGPLDERVVRITELLNLKERGTDADHYKVLAGSALRRALDAVKSSTLSSLEAELGKMSVSDEEFKALISPREKLRRMAKRRGLNTAGKSSLDIDKSLLNNAVVYVVGSIDDEDILTATRCLIIEIVQSARRLRADRTSPVSLFVDELKFLASDVIMRALAAAAYTKLNMSLAFQNFGDMEAPVDQSLNGKALLKNVLTNCQVKLFFGGSDRDTAEWISETSGTVQKRVAKMESTEVGKFGGERWTDKRIIGDVEENLVPVNQVLSLRQRCAIIFQPNHLADAVCVSPIKITPKVLTAPKQAAPAQAAALPGAVPANP
jgi:hypothetical protein